MLGGVARHFHAISREQLVPDQSLSVSHGQHEVEYLRDVVTKRADQVRDGGEVRRGHAAQRHEGHVLLAHPLDRSAADNVLRVGEQHRLEQRCRRIHRRARRVIPEPSIEMRRIDFVIE